MKELTDWITSLSEVEGGDIEPYQDKILELEGLNREIDKVVEASEEKDKTIAEKDEEISKLKDRVWDLFEKRTGISNPNETEKNEEKPKKRTSFVVVEK